MTDWLVQTFAAVTLLMLLVLAIRRPVAQMFGAGWAYALWLVPALRLVLPPLPQLFPESNLPPVVIFIPTAAEATASLPAEAGPGQWVPFLLATWAGGAVIFLTLQWLAYRAFLKRLGDHSRPARPPRYGGISTLISQVVEGPLALGLLEKRIVIPADFSRRYSPSERRLALEHELTHHRRGDIWCNFAAMLVLALNWFNPVAWIAFRAFRADQELACDAAVAARATPEERHDYARALVKSASAPGLIAACPLHHAEQLKQRLRMMRGHRVSRARTAGGLAAVAAFGLAGFSLGGPGEASEAPVVYVAAPEAAAPAPAQPVALAAAVPTTAVAPVARPAAPAKAKATARPRAKTKAAPAPAPAAADDMDRLERVLPQLAMLDVAPAPAPAPKVEPHPRGSIAVPREAPRPVRYYRSASRTHVVVVRDGLTREQRVEVREVVRRVREEAEGEADRAVQLAQLKLELEQHLGATKFKILRLSQGEGEP